MKRNLVYKTEEYVFCTCALRDEMHRRKISNISFSLVNEITVRALFIYSFVVSILLCTISIIIRKLKDFFRRFHYVNITGI